MLAYQRRRKMRNQFERLDRRVSRQQIRKQPHRRLCVFLGDATSDARPRLGAQTQSRGGDNRERSFAADKKVFQIVAGVVFAQRREQIDDFAVGHHRLDSQTQIARAAVANGVHAARVGRQHAADLTTRARPQIERKQQPARARRLLQRFQNNARFDGRRALFRVDGADGAHALERDDNAIGAQRMRRRPAHIPVLPPCGTIASPARAQKRTTAET